MSAPSARLDRDLPVPAKEILRRSTAWLGVEGSHFEPAEAPITAAIAA